MATTKERGIFGENFACSCLKEDGYQILARNWRSGHSEIDIIAQREDVIAFIEVKTRCENAYLSPIQAVSRAQRKRIVLAAVAYLQQRGIYNTGEYQPRFDLFEIVTDRANSPQILRYSHLKAAYDTEGLDVFI